MRTGKLRYAIVLPTIIAVTVVMTLALVVATNSRYSEAHLQMVDNAQSAINAVTAAQKATSLESGRAECPYAADDVPLLFSENSTYRVSFVLPSQAGDNSFAKQAFGVFANDPAALQYSEHDSASATFEYAVPVKWSAACTSCHPGTEPGTVAGLYETSSSTTSYDQSMLGYTAYDILFSLLLAVLCVFVIWIPLRRRVTGPLERLAQETSRITHETLSTRLDSEKIGAQGELADLVSRFNTMIADLEASYDAVEAKVQLRTDELSRAMEELTVHRQEVEALNNQLREESAYKSEFFATMSHELKTPLSSMLANVRFLRLELGGMHEEETFNDIERNGAALLNLINQILDAARLEAGRMKFDEEVVDLLDLINEAESTFRSIATSKMINYRLVIDDDFPLVVTDADKVDKIIRNLVGNALKFTPIGGTVQLAISYSSTESAIVIEVTDNGIGIEGVDTERIFERFYQSDRSETRTYGGTGLGLSLVKEFAELAGGSAQAIALEQGAQFKVVIPARCEEGA